MKKLIEKIVNFLKWIFSSKDIETIENRLEHEIKETEKEIKEIKDRI